MRWIVLAAFVLSVSAGGCRRRVSSRPVVRGYWRTGACSPLCSPGFVCDAGRCVASCNLRCPSGWTCSGSACVPLCNPPCARGQHCGPMRTCEPGPPAPGTVPTSSEPNQQWREPPTGQSAESP